MPLPSSSSARSNALEPLTWQQTSLSTAAPSPAARTPAPERTRSAKPSNKPSAKKEKVAPRPHLHGSASDSAALPSTGSPLNWQQELFQSNPNSSSSFDQPIETTTKRQHSPTKQSHPNTQNTKRQSAKDDETFGLANLEFNPASPRPQRTPHSTSTNDRSTKPSKSSLKSPKPSRSSSNSLLPPSTPTSKSTSNSGTSTPRSALGPGETRYAGPTFHNSPAPSSLPMPSFLLKRQQRDGTAV